MKMTALKLFALLLVFGALAFVPGSIDAKVASDPYTYGEVYDACSGAYDTGAQIAACIDNICSHYGCIE